MINFDSPSDLEAIRRATARKVMEAVRAYREAGEAIEQATAEIERRKLEQTELTEVFQKCTATAELFGFELGAALTQYADDGDEAAHVPPAAPAQPKRLETTIREFVLEEARAAYPEAVQAADLRRKLADEYGMNVHEKTVGMTLYRLSTQKPPVIRRDGRHWFYVERPEQQTTAAPEGATMDLLGYGSVAERSNAPDS